MILVRTPLRVSFAGGFSDVMAQHANGHGRVLSCTIQLYSSILVTGQEDDTVVASYSQVERVERVEHLANAVIRAALQVCGVERGIQIHSVSRLPLASCGLGGSGAACVGIINAIHAMRSVNLSSNTLAEMACDAEINALGRRIGKQDQYAAACGGFNLMHFDGDRVRVELQDFELVQETLNDRCLLLPCIPQDGETPRSASTLLDEQIHEGTSIAQGLNSMVDDCLRAFHAHDPGALAHLVDDGWNLKRRLSPSVATAAVDCAIDEVRRAGGGAKLCGAGGGGYVFAVFQETSQASGFAEKHAGAIPVRWERYGSAVVYDDWERVSEPKSIAQTAGGARD